MEAEFTSNFSSGLELQLKLWRWITNMPSNYGSPMMDFKQTTQSQAFCDGFQICHPDTGLPWWISSMPPSHRSSMVDFKVTEEASEIKVFMTNKISRCLKPSWPISAICITQCFYFKNTFWKMHLKFRTRPDQKKSFQGEHFHDTIEGMEHEAASMEITAAP